MAAAVAEAHGEDEGVGEPPKRRIGWRFMAAAFVIVSSMAAATAVSFLLFLSDIAEGLNDSELSAARAQLEKVDGGEPQTILILGSDKRETTLGDPGRSDTAILLRVDPEKEFLSLMSMPRDLVVPIPGYGPGEAQRRLHLRRAIEEPTGGGETLAIKTITEYLDIPINHVVNVDFTGLLRGGERDRLRLHRRRSSLLQPGGQPGTPPSTSRPGISGSAVTTPWPTCAIATTTTTSSAAPASRTSSARRVSASLRRSSCRSSARATS